MSTYEKGRRAEHYVKRLLQMMGARLVVRSAGSKGPIDLVALFPDEGEVWLIQVKKEKRSISKAERQVLEELSKSLQGPFFIRVYIATKVSGKYEFIPVEGGDR